MKQEQILLIGFGILAVGLAACWEVYSGKLLKNTEITPESLKIGLKNPPLWIFYNNSQVNSRFWSDFGARSSHVLNIPILNLFYQTIANANGSTYRIEVIGGLAGVAELLGVESMPSTLRNLQGSVGPAQEDWIRTAILAKYGGLWLSPSVICLKGFGELPEDKIVAFGQDDVPMYGKGIVPGFRALWVPDQGNPLMLQWEAVMRDRLENQLGGLQIRGDAKSDWVSMKGHPDVELWEHEEFSRHTKTQKKLELEDIFAPSSSTLHVPECAIYMVIPYADLTERSMFSWILRNSEQQILESDMIISNILKPLV